MNQKEPQQKPPTEYLERITFTSELLRRISDINTAIQQGGSGIEEALNLISDLPNSWLQNNEGELKKTLDAINQQYKDKEAGYKIQYKAAIKPTDKLRINNNRLLTGRAYSRAVKAAVIDKLDRMGLLFLTRRAVPESEFVDMRELTDDVKEP